MTSAPRLTQGAVHPLRDLTLRTKQRDPRIRPEEKFTYIDVSSISSESLRIVHTSTLLGSDAPSRARKSVQAGDVLFATVRPSLRRIALVPEELDGAICSTAFTILRPNPEILDSNFLYFQAISEQFVAAVSALQRGSSYPAVSDSDVLSQPLTIPPLDEQRRIARILSAIQSSDASRRSESADLAEVRRSLIEDFFSKAERTIRLSSLIERPQYGFTASASKEGALRFLRITDIQEQGINWDAVPSCDPLPPAGDRYELKDGDLVVARIGATTGKAWLIRNPPASVFASYLIRIRARSEVDPRFLGAFFETRAYWSQIDSAKGSRLKGGVNIENLNSLAVPYLPPSSQRSLGEALDLIMLASNAVWKSAFATSALFDSAMANLLGSVP